MLIYIITNDINNKVYIGQTTKTLEERIDTYKKEINWSKKPRPIIEAIRKYGIEHFHWLILEDNISNQEELDYKEQYYIQYYHSLRHENGYNIELGGNGIGKHSPETRKKISEAQLGSKNHMYGKKGSQNVTSKRVIELTTGQIYDSASLAAEKLKLNFSHVCAVARGTRGSTGGYIFRYLNDNNIPIINSKRAKCKYQTVKNKVLPDLQQYI